MATYTIRQPLYVDDVRRGDLIVAGLGGDPWDIALTKLSASWATIPKGLTIQQLEEHEREWPKGRPVEPTSWLVGTVTAHRNGRPTRMRDTSGQEHNLLPYLKGGYVRYPHRDRFPDPEVALAFAALAPSWLGACDVLHQHAVLSPRPHPDNGNAFRDEVIER